MATMDGSFITMPSPRTYTSVFAVPRSMARSLEKSPARRLISIPTTLVTNVQDDGQKRAASVASDARRDKENDQDFREDGRREPGPENRHATRLGSEAKHAVFQAS